MADSANGEKCDNRAVVGQCVERAGCHRRHSVHGLERYADGVREIDKRRSESVQRDAHAPGGRASHSG